MGLDWVLHKIRAREGCEDEFEVIDAEFRRLPKEDPKLEGLRLRLLEIGITAVDVLGCPKIGIDPEADAWFETHVYLSNQKDIQEHKAEGRFTPLEFTVFWSRPLKEVIEDHYGQPVIDLAKEQAGIARIVGIVTGPLDFRGGSIGRMEMLDDDLQAEAFVDHSAEEMLDYADRLHAQMRRLESDDQRTLKSAIEWLEFWGGNGFGFWAWY